MNKIAINGRIFEFPITGVGRFCVETLKEIDKNSVAKRYELIVPKDAENVPTLNAIKIVRTHRGKGIFWEQIVFPLYAVFHKMKTLNMSNSVPLIKPDYVVIHDISLKENRFSASSFKDKLKIWWPLLHYKISSLFSKKIFTVSEYQKKAIMKNYNVRDERIVVVYNGWEHMNTIKEDDSILDRFHLEAGNYFFALSTRAKNKNFRWVIEEAKNNPDLIFVVSGKLDTKYFKDEVDLDSIMNVIATGYVSDGQMKSLMKNARAFLYPSTYEGFGIPPLEAISVRTKAIVANATCLPEIYGDSVYYIDPYNTNVDLEKLISKELDPNSVEDVLKRYSWSKTASKIIDAIV